MELADLNNKGNTKKNESLFFLQSRACLMGWSATEKEELQHLISESHKGSAQKKRFFGSRKIARSQPQPRPNPSPWQPAQRENKKAKLSDARAVWLSG